MNNYTPQEILEALEEYGSERKAAEALGIPRTTMRRRIGREGGSECADGLEFEPVVSEDVPVEELWRRKGEDFRRIRQHADEQFLRRVKVRDDGPIAIWHFGDPHVDDDGCNVAELLHHADLVRETDHVYGASAGDQTNNWVGRLAQLYGNQRATQMDGWRLSEDFFQRVGKWLYVIGGNHECHGMDTEALTMRGWKKYDDIRDDDFVFGMNTETGYGQWQPIQERFCRDNTDEMIRTRGVVANMSVTPGHRVLLQRVRQGGMAPLEYVRADELPSKFAIPVAAHVNNVGVSWLTVEQIELAGWILTDGCICWKGNSPKISISQSKDATRLEGLLEACGLPYKKKTRFRDIKEICGKKLKKPPRPSTEYTLSAETSRRVLQWVPRKGELPQWAWDLNDAQFDALLEGIIAGDGSWASNGKRTAAIVYSPMHFLESLQAIAVQHGWSATTRTVRGNDHRLNLARRTTSMYNRKASVYRAEPEPRVWCLSVPLTNFMVRRNGNPFFSGNCFSGDSNPIPWILKNLNAPYAKHGARIQLAFPRGHSIIINARHDFGGSSIWNPCHGLMKAAQKGWCDHIFIAGHRHISGYGTVRNPDQHTGIDGGRVSHCIRVAGYKEIDDYAAKGGFPDHSYGPGAMTVLDPLATKEENLVQVFWDPEYGIDWLQHLRRRYAA